MEISIETSIESNSRLGDSIVTRLWVEDRGKEPFLAHTDWQHYKEIRDACKRIWERLETEVKDPKDAEQMLLEAGAKLSLLLSGGQTHSNEAFEDGPKGAYGIEDNKGALSFRGLEQHMPGRDSPYEVLADWLDPSRLRHETNAYVFISCHDSVLEELPWELLAIKIDGNVRHIGLMPQVRIVRFGKQSTIDPPKREQAIECRIFNVDMSNTSIGGLEKITALPLPEKLIYRSLNDSDITLNELGNALWESDDYTIFHYSGHGQLNEKDLVPELCLRGSGSSSDSMKGVRAEDLISAMTASRDSGQLPPVLAVLACCDVGLSSGWQGFGTTLLDKGLPATISMQARVQDGAANRFAEELYRSLQEGHSIAWAVTDARIAVRCLDDPYDRRDWWIPILHTRNPYFVFADPSQASVNKGKSIAKLIQENKPEPSGVFYRERFLKQELAHCDSSIMQIWADTGTVSERLYVHYGYAMSQGKLDSQEEIRDAHKVLSDLLPQSEKELGDHHPITLSIRTLICLHACRLHKHNEALLQLKELETEQAKALGEKHPLTLITRYLTADCTFARGDWSKALAFYRQLHTDRTRALGPGHTNTLNTRFNIAACTAKNDDWDKALVLYQQLYTDQTKALGDDDPNTLNTRSMIASCTGELGNWYKSLALYQQLYTDQTKALGDDDPNTLNTRSMIASCTGELGNWYKSLALYQQLYTDQTKALGDDDPNTLNTRLNIAACTGQLGNWAEALALYQQLLPDQTELLGPSHPDTLDTRWRRTFSYYQQLLPDQTELLGPGHPDTLDTRAHIAWFTARLDDPDKALAIYEQLLPDQTELLGPGHPDTLDTRFHIASLTDKPGNEDKALRLYKQLLPDLVANLGGDHTRTLHARTVIARLSGILGNRN